MPKALLLTGISGSRVGKHVQIEQRTSVVGSAPGCDIVLHDRQILARHAEFRQSLDRWFVAALDASALVAVNGQRVSGQSRVSEGDLVTIGSATFKAALSDSFEFGGARR